MKTWDLEFLQSVRVDEYQQQAYFQHHSLIDKTWKGISLSYEEFCNLNDIILNWENYKNIEVIPIGQSLWLYNKQYMKHLYNRDTKMYFTFFYQSWLHYTQTIHYLVWQFIRKQNEYRLQHRECNAKRPNSLCYRSRKSTQRHSHIQVPTRTTTNGSDSFKQRKKYSTISKRKDTTTGCDFQFRRTANEVRAANKVDEHSGSDADVSEMDNIEPCSID